MKEVLSSSETSVPTGPCGVTSQKTPFFIVTAVKISNITRYYPCNKPRKAIWLLDVKAPTFLDKRFPDGDEIVNLKHQLPFGPKKILDTHFCC
jgi:hypothetical protein